MSTRSLILLLMISSSMSGCIFEDEEGNVQEITTTDEILDEGQAHQFFYQFSEGLDMTSQYNDSDSDGNPIGIQFILITGSAAGSGDFTLVLQSEPMKPNSGLDDAGGATDIEITFPIVID